MVFQQFNLFPNMSVLRNITEAPVTVLGMSKDEAVERAKGLLDMVGLADKCDARPAQLSGGQQQRVAIARALAMRPKVLLLDEVTSALDPELVAGVLDLLRDIARSTDITMLCVTHEMNFARDISDQVLMFDSGRVIEAGAPEKIFSEPEHDRTREFLERGPVTAPRERPNVRGRDVGAFHRHVPAGLRRRWEPRKSANTPPRVAAWPVWWRAGCASARGAHRGAAAQADRAAPLGPGRAARPGDDDAAHLRCHRHRDDRRSGLGRERLTPLLRMLRREGYVEQTADGAYVTGEALARLGWAEAASRPCATSSSAPWTGCATRWAPPSTSAGTSTARSASPSTPTARARPG
ncbi:Vitamin B12 import ATP-binding protein BtuD [Streptomyces violaceorubidus]